MLPTASSKETEMEVDESTSSQSAARENMLNDVAHSNGFFKSQQRGEKDLTYDQKWKIADDLLQKNKALFLQRYWKFLNIDDISFFEDDCNDYEVGHYLAEIQKMHDKKKYRAKIKNRRFEAMKEMVKGGSYFSENEMRQRNPLLYEQLVGKYLTADERSAISQEASKVKSFSDFLVGQIDRSYVNHLMKMQEEEENQVVEENDDDSEEEEEEEEFEEEEGTAFGQANITLPDCEKQMLKSEFTNIMYENFLSGKDENFDYSSIDNNAEYDSVLQRNIDEEEKYFDEDSSESTGDNAS